MIYFYQIELFLETTQLFRYYTSYKPFTLSPLCILIYNCDRYCTYSFHREDSDAEEIWEGSDVPDHRATADWWHVFHELVHGYSKTGAHANVGDHGHWRQVLQIRYPAQENHGKQQHGDDWSQLCFVPYVIVHDLFEIRRYDDCVHAAGAEVRQEQAYLDEVPEEIEEFN